VEAVLIHKHHVRISPRLIPGSSPRSALHCFGLQPGMQDLMRFATRSRQCALLSTMPDRFRK
jgi:hypothetical protein